MPVIAAIIPARMAASRYPGKPLLDIQGLPMIEHVRRRVALCKRFSEVVVATCDKEIADAVSNFGGKVIMTSSQHTMATDRVAEAAQHLDCTHVVNVQGDEVLILPQDLECMVEAIENDLGGRYWNATALLESTDKLTDTDVVKCVVSRSERVLYCARDFSHLKLARDFDPVRKILGVLAFNRKGLLTYSQLPRTPIEISQSIDQSRVLENDLPLQGVRISAGYIGINNKKEEKAVRRILEADSLQKSILCQTLACG